MCGLRAAWHTGLAGCSVLPPGLATLTVTGRWHLLGFSAAGPVFLCNWLPRRKVLCQGPISCQASPG